MRTMASAASARPGAEPVPYAAEEVWSWWRPGSIHVATWPVPVAAGGDAALIDTALEVLARVRRTKTEAKVSQRAEVERVDVTLPDAMREALGAATDDLLEAGSIRDLEVVEGAEFACDVRLTAVA